MLLVQHRVLNLMDSFDSHNLLSLAATHEIFCSSNIHLCIWCFITFTFIYFHTPVKYSVVQTGTWKVHTTKKVYIVGASSFMYRMFHHKLLSLKATHEIFCSSNSYLKSSYGQTSIHRWGLFIYVLGVSFCLMLDVYNAKLCSVPPTSLWKCHKFEYLFWGLT